MAAKTKKQNTSASKRDIYQEVTDRVIAALDDNIVLWRKPWRAQNGDYRHRNLVSKHFYRGINQFLLELTAMERGYTSPYWLSFKQVKDKGGNVIRGEKSTLVVFWKPIEFKDEDENGEEKTVKRLILRHYNVFNVEQCEGIEAPVTEVEEFDSIEKAEDVIRNMPQRPVMSWGGDSASYNPLSDSVRLPGKTSFVTPESYYLTAFHELAHATGHESRLNVKDAFPGQFGSVPYAREELRAEMTAAMIAAVLKMDPDISNSTAYVRHWLSAAEYKEALKSDKRLLVTAAARAQKAADWILGDNGEES